MNYFTHRGKRKYFPKVKCFALWAPIATSQNDRGFPCEWFLSVIRYPRARTPSVFFIFASLEPGTEVGRRGRRRERMRGRERENMHGVR